MPRAVSQFSQVVSSWSRFWQVLRCGDGREVHASLGGKQLNRQPRHHVEVPDVLLEHRAAGAGQQPEAGDLTDVDASKQRGPVAVTTRNGNGAHVVRSSRRSGNSSS
jgi:hypothetical protein